MILAVDIGNTNVSLGVFSPEGELLNTFSLPDNVDYLSGEWMRLLESNIKELENIKGAVISSVVPAITENIMPALENSIDGKIISVSGKIKSFSEIKYDREKLGGDRIASCFGAMRLYGCPAAVFDMGTATTLSVAGENQVFLGGMIMPGLRLSVDALSSRAALLPFAELKKPSSLLGSDTASSMVNGAVFGTASAVDGISNMIEKELGTEIFTVLTGGGAALIKPYIKRKVIYDPYLLLKGLKLLYDENS